LSSISASIEGSIPEKAADWQANVSDSGAGVPRSLNLRFDEPFVGRRVEWIIEPETQADEIVRVAV